MAAKRGPAYNHNKDNKACKKNSHGKLDPGHLPVWFRKGLEYITCNHTMPSLTYLSMDLQAYLGDELLTVCRYGGVHCPVSLLHKRPYVHRSNGVYIGVKVYIKFICL